MLSAARSNAVKAASSLPYIFPAVFQSTRGMALQGVKDRKQARSKYGAKKPKAK